MMSISRSQARDSCGRLGTACSSAPTMRTNVSAMPAVSKCSSNESKMLLLACQKRKSLHKNNVELFQAMYLTHPNRHAPRDQACILVKGSRQFCTFDS